MIGLPSKEPTWPRSVAGGLLLSTAVFWLAAAIAITGLSPGPLTWIGYVTKWMYTILMFGCPALALLVCVVSGFRRRSSADTPRWPWVMAVGAVAFLFLGGFAIMQSA